MKKHPATMFRLLNERIDPCDHGCFGPFSFFYFYFNGPHESAADASQLAHLSEELKDTYPGLVTMMTTAYKVSSGKVTGLASFPHLTSN
ncbi:MAG TPA: hypothetical protein VIR29_05525 [Anseongella sp.]